MTKAKQQLINDVLTGLLVAATFAVAAPVDVLAQNLAAVGSGASTNIMKPIVEFASYAAYGLGTVSMVAGIAAAKKHSETPQNNPLGPALGKMGAGAAFLVAPSVAGMLAGTASATGVGSTSATFTTIGGQ